MLVSGLTASLPPLNQQASTSTPLTLNEIIEKINKAPFFLEEFNTNKAAIEKIFRENTEKLNEFLNEIISWGITTTAFTEILDFLSTSISYSQLEQAIQTTLGGEEICFTSASDWAKSQDIFFSNEKVNLSVSYKNHWIKAAYQITSIVPHLFNLLINSFSYLDCHKKFTSLWDRFALLDVLYKFCLIPLTLTRVLTPILKTPLKIYLTTLSIITCCAIAAANYKKRMMAYPDEILNCENLDKKAAAGEFKNKIGTPNELPQLVAHLLAGSNVLLVGKSGNGKTSLFQMLVQMKEEKKLPIELQKLHFFNFDCSALQGTSTFGYGELIYQTKTQIQNPKETLLFIDELDQLVTDRNAFEAIKTHFLSEGGPRIVAATTPEGAEKIDETLGASFGARVQKITIAPPDDTMIELILWDYLKNEAADLPLDPNCMQKLLEIAKKNSNTSSAGVIALAKNKLKEAIGRCRYSFSTLYTVPELSDLKNRYQCIINRIEATGDINQEDRRQVLDLNEQIQQLENSLRTYKLKMKAILHLVKMQNTLTHLHSQLLKKVAFDEASSEKTKTHYLICEFFAKKKLINQLNQAIQEAQQHQNYAMTHSPIYINAHLIEQLFQQTS